MVALAMRVLDEARTPRPDEVLLLKERRSLLAKALRRVPADARTALLLSVGYAADGIPRQPMPRNEIAQLCGSDIDARVLIGHALRRLRSAPEVRAIDGCSLNRAVIVRAALKRHDERQRALERAENHTRAEAMRLQRELSWVDGQLLERLRQHARPRKKLRRDHVSARIATEAVSLARRAGVPEIECAVVTPQQLELVRFALRWHRPISAFGRIVGNATRDAACYYSADGGTTPRAYSEIECGDLLYWATAEELGDGAPLEVCPDDRNEQAR